jgi:hypothetical protein
MAADDQGPSENAGSRRVIRPGPDAEKPLDLTASIRQKREKIPTVTERLEMRVDGYLSELKQDKDRLSREVDRLRGHEIHHLRNDVRWLEERVLHESQALARLQTSYEWAIAFSWFSFALVAIGGGLVSYAAFASPHSATQQIVATMGLTSLVIGVIVQAVNSYRGGRAILSTVTPPTQYDRPSANP